MSLNDNTNALNNLLNQVESLPNRDGENYDMEIKLYSNPYPDDEYRLNLTGINWNKIEENFNNGEGVIIRFNTSCYYNSALIVSSQNIYPYISNFGGDVALFFEINDPINTIFNSEHKLRIEIYRDNTFSITGLDIV